MLDSLETCLVVLWACNRNNIGKKICHLSAIIYCNSLAYIISDLSYLSLHSNLGVHFIHYKINVTAQYICNMLVNQ